MSTMYYEGADRGKTNAKRYFEGEQLAAAYASVRPSPPLSLTMGVLNYIKEEHPGGPLELVVDVGCGSGQVARVMAPHFTRVVGVDVSPAQIETAKAMENPSNVSFQVMRGEDEFPVAAGTANLVCSCMAAHWFNMEDFIHNTDAALAPGGVVALIGYFIPQPLWPGKTQQLKEVMWDMHRNKMGEFFGRQERDEIDVAYTGDKYRLPYPDTVSEQDHFTDLLLTVENIGLYITTMSGYTGFTHHHGEPAAQQLREDFVARLMKVLGVKTPAKHTWLPVRFQYFIRMARKPLQ